MVDLADRAEAGEALRPLILALNDAMMPTMTDEQADAFVRLLDINTPEAHLAAAMMLKPAGWGIKLTEPRPDGALESVTGPLPCVAVLIDPAKALPTGTGPTPAHALIAAIARSQADGR